MEDTTEMKVIPEVGNEKKKPNESNQNSFVNFSCRFMYNVRKSNNLVVAGASYAICALIPTAVWAGAGGDKDVGVYSFIAYTALYLTIYSACMAKKTYVEETAEAKDRDIEAVKATEETPTEKTSLVNR